MQREILTAYYFADPAFAGWKARDAIAWAQQRDPEKMPELPPGAEPVEYRFRRLKRSQIYDFVQTARTEQERYERAFAAGVVEIRGGRYGSKGWTPSTLGEKAHVAASFEELEEAEITLAETWDVGQWIYARSVLGKGSAPSLPVLPSSLLAWDALERPSAEQSQE